jgi:hypothetical protein
VPSLERNGSIKELTTQHRDSDHTRHEASKNEVFIIKNRFLLSTVGGIIRYAIAKALATAVHFTSQHIFQDWDCLGPLGAHMSGRTGPYPSRSPLVSSSQIPL